jgi:hypothetical protein
MGLELKKGLESFLKNIEANCHSSSSYVFNIVPLFFMFQEHL